jgi:hypothetical protein
MNDAKGRRPRIAGEEWTKSDVPNLPICNQLFEEAQCRELFTRTAYWQIDADECPLSAVVAINIVELNRFIAKRSTIASFHPIS